MSSSSNLSSFATAMMVGQIVETLEEENRSLRQKLQQSKSSDRLITITGRGGSPVYAEGHLDGAFNCGPNDDDDEMILKLRNAKNDASLAMCKIRDVESAEVRLGGNLLHVVGQCRECYADVEEGPFSRLIYAFGDGPMGHRLWVKFGPVPRKIRKRKRAPSPNRLRNKDIAEVQFEDFVFDSSLGDTKEE